MFNTFALSESYLKIALRNLLRNRSYSSLNILGLSLGITGALLVFLFLQYHLSTDRHQPNFVRVYRVVLNLLLDEGVEHNTDSSIPMATALARDYSQIEIVGFIRRNPNTTLSSNPGTGVKRFIEKDNVVFANEGFMQMFAFKWLGVDASALMTEPYTVVVSVEAALKYFGTTSVVGKTLKFANSTDLKIVGIVQDETLPSDLDFKVYISLPTLKRIEPDYELDNFGWLSSRNTTFVRLAAGANPVQTEKLIRKNSFKYYGETAKYYDHRLQPLADLHFDARYGGKIRRSVLWVFMGVGMFLIVIAGINFVNLATSQALKRAKEIGIRKVLGSTQSQLFWQFMGETALLAFGSAFLALILVALLLPVLNSWTHTQAFHFTGLFQFQLFLFWISTLLSVVLIAGFYPSVVISGFNPIAALKSKPGTQQVGGMGLRRSLVILQLIIAQVLVIGTLVLVLQLSYFKNADIGFDARAVIVIPLPKINPDRKIMKSMINNLLQYPDVMSASYQYEAPTSGMGYGGSLRFDNRPDWEKFIIRDRFGDENYLSTYKIPLLAGRNITGRDSVVEFVVNEELMHKLGITDPQRMLGRQLEDGNTALKGTIVGVAKSFHLKSLQEPVEPCAIFANPRLYKEVAVKLNTKDFSKTIHLIQKAWQKSYPYEVFSFQFVEEEIARLYEKEEELKTLIRSFAMVAMLLCCLGLYGMVSFTVAQRTKEIGVRKVLGAGLGTIVLLLGQEFFILVSIAFIFAAPAAWYLTGNWLNGFAYRIALDWWILGSGGVLILLITLLTVSFKVVTAAMMNPVESLRVE